MARSVLPSYQKLPVDPAETMDWLSTIPIVSTTGMLYKEGSAYVAAAFGGFLKERTKYMLIEFQKIIHAKNTTFILNIFCCQNSPKCKSPAAFGSMLNF